MIEDMGIPAGKPKTIVVDLTDKFLSASREVRIVTNLCVYWDEIFLAAATGAAGGRHSASSPVVQAALRFRGFSRPVIHPERKQPERFDYQSWMPVSMWNPTPGLYTRYGDVRPLLAGIDDRLVVMGSGDELRLRFDAAALPPLPAGWRRDFLLFVDGWAKDGDANTAFSQTVEPLPFHGMSQYPYPEGERFPGGEVNDRDRQRYKHPPRPPPVAPVAGTGGDALMSGQKLGAGLGIGAITAALFVALLVNTAYIAAFAEPTVFYMGNVLLHFVLGLVLAAAVGLLFRRRPGLGRELAVPAVLFTVALVAGIALAVVGNVVPNRWLLWTHIVAAVLAVAALVPWLWRRAFEAGQAGRGGRRFGRIALAAVLLLAVLPATLALWRRAHPPVREIRNPLIVPASMNEEGEGPKSPFFPSSARTNVGGIIPSNFFMDSDAAASATRTSTTVEQLGAPLRVVQQPVLPQVDRVHAGRRRHRAEQVVRRLPRPRGVLQRPLRPADQGADRHAGSAGRPRLHLVPLDRPRRQHDGPGRLHHRVPAAPRSRRRARTR